MRIIFLLLFVFTFTLLGIPQGARKSVSAIPTTESIKIDGVLDEAIWDEAPMAEDFIQQRPYNGAPA
ncbi:MAG: hypothetical protein H8D67_03010, partial [Deltaproteobacteria bacterium]|nr:hypothetical protein [Deltaproteobacteria bacterium]